MSKQQVIRKVRDGRVKIGGKFYRPCGQYMAYDGRCDGHRFLFGRYPAPWLPGGYEPHVSICCTEKQLRGKEDYQSGPDVVDGTLPWLFWEEVEQ